MIWAAGFPAAYMRYIMTIAEAIDRADSLRPNQYTFTQKVNWLSDLDNQAYEEVLLMAKKNWKPKVIEQIIDGEVTQKEDPRQLVPVFDFNGYDETTPETTELLIDDIYAGCYIDWLISKIDYYNREAAAYNNSSAVFNAQYQSWCSWYRSKNMPIGRRVQRI